MALRVDAVGDSLSRASALTITSFTLMGWSQVVTDRGATTWQQLAGAQVTADAYIAWGWSTNDGTSSVSELGNWNGTTWTSVIFGSRPAVGDWFHWYLKCAGTGANQLEAGWRRLQDSSYVTGTTTLGSGITGSASALISNDPNFSFWGNMRHAAIKGYSGALSAGDIERERLTFAPQSTTNLLFSVPMVHATVADSVRDFGGAGANFTAGGTLTVEGGPPIAFRQGRRRLIIQAATGSNKTLAADAGSYSLTGTAATLKVARINTAGAGSYALTGTAATLRRNLPLVAGAGSYSLTGTAASVLHNWINTAGAGSYALTGTAATPKHGYAVGAGAGSYALSGAAASLLHNWILSAGSGSYALTGSDATLTVTSTAQSLLASPGSYALTGSAASVLHGWSVAGSAGSYALTGTAAAVNHGWAAAAAAGSYSISGQAATLLHTWKVSAAVGSYSLTGTNATPAVGKVAVAGSGSYALSGAAATLLLGRNIAADSGGYLLSGSSATLTAAGETGSTEDYHNLSFIASVGPMTAH